MNILSFQRPAIASFACLVALLFAGSVYAAVGEKQPPPQENDRRWNSIRKRCRSPGKAISRYARQTRHQSLNHLQQDLFFIDKGTQRGATHDIFIEYERNLNQQLMKEKSSNIAI